MFFLQNLTFREVGVGATQNFSRVRPSAPRPKPGAVACRSASGAWWPALPAGGPCESLCGGGTCSLTGFFLKLNWAAFSASSGLRASPFASPSLSASGLRVAPSFHFVLRFGAPRCPFFTFAVRIGAPRCPFLHLRCPHWGSALPLSSPSLSALGLRVALSSPSMSALGLRVAPLLVSSSSNHGAKIGRVFELSKFFAVIRAKNGCDKERFRTAPRCRPLKRGLGEKG